MGGRGTPLAARNGMESRHWGGEGAGLTGYYVYRLLEVSKTCYSSKLVDFLYLE